MIRRLIIASVSCALVLSARAESELEIAREALRDGLWDVARTHANRVAPADQDKARLVTLESLAAEKKWDEVAKTLSNWPDAKGDAFDYYRALVRGDHAAAMKILKLVNSPEGLAEARAYEAQCAAEVGNTNGARTIWAELAANTNLCERVRALAAANLNETNVLNAVYANSRTGRYRLLVGLRLARALVQDAKTFDEGERLVRKLVKENPDAAEARETYLALIAALVRDQKWSAVAEPCRVALETWPDTAKDERIPYARGMAAFRLGKLDEALPDFTRMLEISTNAEAKATAAVKIGEIQRDLGRTAEARRRFDGVLRDYPETGAAKGLKRFIELDDLETAGREAFKAGKFAEANDIFARIEGMDPKSHARMAYFRALCAYGRNDDDQAKRIMTDLSKNATDDRVRSLAALWLAKFNYNHQNWRQAIAHFLASAAADGDEADDARLWAARAAFKCQDFKTAIREAGKVGESAKDETLRSRANLLLGEALIEVSLYNQAMHALERVTGSSDERRRAQLLRADVLYSLGADDRANYAAALDAYRAVYFAEKLSASDRIVTAFKMARALEKLGRLNEAIDQYYAKVVLAYREARRNRVRISDDALAAFARAAFWLADVFESEGSLAKARDVLQLVATSGVPAAQEAAKRCERIRTKERSEL